MQAESFEPDLNHIDAEGVDIDAVKRCAALDHSDVDNGKRASCSFRRDLVVHERIGAPDGDWLAWEGRYWDFGGGEARAKMIAQKLGDRIVLECAFLKATEDELETIAKAAKFAASDVSAAAKEAREAAEESRRR